MMCKYFHYSTWNGQEIYETGIVKPSLLWNGENDLAPKLVFATKNPVWEPSVQALAKGEKLEDYTKFPSNVKYLIDKRIPCWKFEIELPTESKLVYNVPGFIHMLQDAVKLGTDLALWGWTEKECKVLHSMKLG